MKKAESTVRLDIRRLDDPQDKYPSFSQLESGMFSAPYLGDPALFTIEGMTMACGHHPQTGVDASGFQLTFIPGGLIFTVHRHHLICDVTGLASLVRQIADNCKAVFKGASAPHWDESLMDRSRFITPAVAEKDQKEPPPAPKRHPDWLPCSWLLFHIPQGKVAELKKSATPVDGTWISTYDALIAFIWRVVTKNRAHIYKPDLSQPAIFMEAVNMRNRRK